MFCVEAMFHFRSRSAFLRDAARVLRDGGRVTVSDILLRSPGPDAPRSLKTIETTGQADYGPWPQSWLTVDDAVAAAAAAGLQVERFFDATREDFAQLSHNSTPTTGIITTIGGTVMRWLHEAGHLTYARLSFLKKCNAYSTIRKVEFRFSEKIMIQLYHDATFRYSANIELHRFIGRLGPSRTRSADAEIVSR